MLEIKLQKHLKKFNLDLDLAVPPGITVLFGHSGAGKSMTLSCVAGLAKPDRGRIAVNGTLFFDSQSGLNLPPQRRGVGYVTQNYLLFPHLTVAENVAFGLSGYSRQEKTAIVEDMLRRVGLVDLARQRPAELSGGQQQRVALARALVTRPKVLLLDEPFSALDGPTRSRLRRDLPSLQRDLRLPVLFVTHDLAEAYLLADYIAVIDEGRLLQFGHPEAVIYQPAGRQVAELTGGRNFFNGQILDRDHHHSTIQVGQLTLTGPPAALPPGSPVEISIRGERIMLIRKDAPVGPRENQIEGCIVEELTDGFNHTLFFRINDGQRLNHDRYDLEIILPAYVYERLKVHQRNKQWAATIKREAIHILGAS